MCDELFPVVKMPPRKSTPLVCVTPDRLAALEGEVKRLREALDIVRRRCTMWADSGANLEGHRLRLVRLADFARMAQDPTP